MTGVTADRMLTTGQAAARLGLGREWLWRLARDGRVPAVRVGRQYALRESDVDRLREDRGAR